MNDGKTMRITHRSMSRRQPWQSAIRLLARRLKSWAVGGEARLRGLDMAIPDYLLKNHQPRAPGSEACLRGLDWAIPNYLLKNHQPKAPWRTELFYLHQLPGRRADKGVCRIPTPVFPSPAAMLLAATV